jgi:hypothetical protein
MTVNLVTGTRLQRQFWRVYRIGDGAPVRHRWGCEIDIDAGGLDVRIAAPEEPADSGRAADAGLEEAESRLHEALFRRLPPALCTGARSEAGVVSTRIWHDGRSLGLRHGVYTLATSADVLLTLTDRLAPTLTTPWRGTCAPSDIDADLPVALGPSAVLSLTAGVLELCDNPDNNLDNAANLDNPVPEWMSVDSVPRSPYPPHDWPLELADGHVELGGHQSATVAWWATRSDHWMRPMRTTRASRGQYSVGATLPMAVPMARGEEPSVLWIESLVSLDTLGHTWQASLSLGRGDERWWLTQPVSVDFPAYELLQAAVGRLEPARPALDRDPVDGESFGWAPALLTSRTAGELGLGRRST